MLNIITGIIMLMSNPEKKMFVYYYTTVDIALYHSNAMALKQQCNNIDHFFYRSVMHRI